jgi:hypothetical protein
MFPSKKIFPAPIAGSQLGATTIRRAVLVRSAGFQTCCIADFQVGRALEVVRPAGLETRDTADLEVGATVAVSNCAPIAAGRFSDFDFMGLTSFI